jgi:hypothetical protein
MEAKKLPDFCGNISGFFCSSPGLKWILRSVSLRVCLPQQEGDDEPLGKRGCGGLVRDGGSVSASVRGEGDAWASAAVGSDDDGDGGSEGAPSVDGGEGDAAATLKRDGASSTDDSAGVACASDAADGDSPAPVPPLTAVKALSPLQYQPALPTQQPPEQEAAPQPPTGQHICRCAGRSRPAHQPRQPAGTANQTPLNHHKKGTLCCKSCTLCTFCTADILHNLNLFSIHQSEQRFFKFDSALLFHCAELAL